MVWMEDFDGRGLSDPLDEGAEIIIFSPSAVKTSSRLRMRSLGRFVRSHGIDEPGERYPGGRISAAHSLAIAA